MAKRFFFVCAGILCLAIAYHFGAVNAAAQSSQHIRLISSYGDNVWVVTDQDEIYSINRSMATSMSKGIGWSRYSLGVLH
jgi:hypothetical protein